MIFSILLAGTNQKRLYSAFLTGPFFGECSANAATLFLNRYLLNRSSPPPERSPQAAHLYLYACQSMCQTERKPKLSLRELQLQILLSCKAPTLLNSLTRQKPSAIQFAEVRSQIASRNFHRDTSLENIHTYSKNAPAHDSYP